MLTSGTILAQEAPLPDAEIALADWPKGWSSAYQRFEEFLLAKKQYWPVSGLHLVNDSGFIHGIANKRGEDSSAALDIFANGQMTLSTATRPPTSNDLSYFAPGLYSICATNCSRLDFQYNFPIIWFESVQPKLSGLQTESRITRNKLRIVPAPGEGMAIFPNERLLGFRDFHIVTERQYRSELQRDNKSTLPSVHLGIDDYGVVEREILPDAKAEALLKWRIYFNGKLVDSGAATDTIRREMTHGPGNYLIIVGPEGPAGFLPVSNFLEFPLFPDGKDKPQVFPRDTDADGTPDFIQNMVSSGKLATYDILEGQDTDNDGLTDIEEAGPLSIAPSSISKAKDNELLQLWSQWNYELKNRKPWWK